jgi:hypothetical protein
MSERLIGSKAEWIALCRAAMTDRGLTTREVDCRANLGEGYMAKLMCGQVNAPTWRTVERVNEALGIKLYAKREPLTP